MVQIDFGKRFDRFEQAGKNFHQWRKERKVGPSKRRLKFMNIQ